MSEDSSKIGVSGTIPFFFYDAIARILPGAVLLIGAILYFTKDLRCAFHETFPNELSGGYATTIILLFFGTAHFLGILLNSLSHYAVEELWGLKFKLNMEGLTTFLAMHSDAKTLKARFKTAFGHELQDVSLNKASFLCSYYVWKTDSNLGLMSTRADAEMLSSQSLVLVSLLLLILPIRDLACIHSRSVRSDIYWIAGFAFILAGSFFTFIYMREKRLYSRFSLFLAATGSALPPENNEPTPPEPPKGPHSHK